MHKKIAKRLSNKPFWDETFEKKHPNLQRTFQKQYLSKRGIRFPLVLFVRIAQN